MTDHDDLARRHASVTAPHLVYAVHAVDADRVAELLAPLGRQDLFALAVVLASRIPHPLTRPDDGVVDELAVERTAAEGASGPLTSAERLAAVRIMLARGLGTSVISTRLRVSGKQARDLIGQVRAAGDELDGWVRDLEAERMRPVPPKEGAA